MGNWSQRTRCGGGNPVSHPGLTTILRVLIGDNADGTVVVFFSAPVNSADLNVDDFQIDALGSATLVGPAGINDTAVYQSDDWVEALVLGQAWTYSGVTPNVLTPQTGVIVAP